MQLFIDTNIFLSFYHFKSDDLEELKKLNILLNMQEITLLLTDQVIDEFNRNREKKIMDAVRHLKDQHLNLKFPQLCKDYEEYQRLRDCQKEYEKEHSTLLAKISEDVKRKTLKADIIISDLFKSGKRIATTDYIISSARLRIETGNPPGKSGSLGDAINWEALLTDSLDEEDIYFITDDKDYSSCVDSETFNEFLLEEWKQKRGTKLLYFKQLSSLFKTSFPDIKLASELEKDLLIQELSNSENFMHTHRIAAKLNHYSDFTSAQANRIVEASLSNRQVCWIIEDKDIKQLLLRIVLGNESNIDKENLRAIKTSLKIEDAQNQRPFDPYDIPF